MKNKKHDIVFYSSDILATTGLKHTLQNLPVALKPLAASSMHDVVFYCEKYKPRLVIYLFHENMPLGGVLHAIYMNQHNYPDMRQLIITSKLLPIFTALRDYLPSVNVAPLKTPLAEIEWIITAELMGVRSHLSKSLCAEVMLPDRQLKVLLMLSWAYSAEQIAQRLGITAKTVYAHKLSALTRLQIHTRHDIANLYAVIDELRMIVTMLRHQRRDRDMAASDPLSRKAIPALSWKI